MVYCSYQYSLEGPNNQKTIYYNLATDQMPYWMLPSVRCSTLAPALAIVALEDGGGYLENGGMLSHFPFCNILAAA